MPKLPRISGRQTVKKFEKLGYEVVRQKGSHKRLLHPTKMVRQPLTIPDHTELGKGLLRKLIRQAGITVEEFINL